MIGPRQKVQKYIKKIIQNMNLLIMEKRNNDCIRIVNYLPGKHFSHIVNETFHFSELTNVLFT